MPGVQPVISKTIRQFWRETSSAFQDQKLKLLKELETLLTGRKDIWRNRLTQRNYQKKRNRFPVKWKRPRMRRSIRLDRRSKGLGMRQRTTSTFFKSIPETTQYERSCLPSE